MVSMKSLGAGTESEHGFTLVELIVVLIVLGILALIIVPRFVDLRGKATNAVRAANIGTLHSSLLLYRAEHNGVAPTVSELAYMITGNNRPTVRGGSLYFKTGDGKQYSIQTYSDSLCRGRPNRSSRNRVACIK